MLDRLIKERHPAMLAVAMDSVGSFRRKSYPNYKATRPKPPADLLSQIRRCREIVEAYRLPVFAQDGWEADDVIFSLVKTAQELAWYTVVVSSDKDLFQLVAPDVLCWDTMRDRVFGVEEVQQRFGVRVAQLRDYFGLIGDSSDNIPGVPSVGPKTARTLLQEYASLEVIYENLGSIKSKRLRTVLHGNKKQAFLSRWLVTLFDPPISVDPSQLKVRFGAGRDIEALRRIYTELGFASHLQRLG
jgi:DNA polymerase-1